MPHLPADLRLRILALLPPHDLALAGRFTCRQAAQHFGSRPQDLTAHLRQPLPGHVVTAVWCLEGARVAMRQLSLRQKLLLLSTAAASGCEANVEFAWQLLQPHVFPELLQTDHYHKLLMRKAPGDLKAAVPNVGPAAVASGLAHLLPSLEQRCPGLLDPARTLEAAARHCDLAGLQAAWEVVGQRLLSSLQPDGEQPEPYQAAGGEQAAPGQAAGGEQPVPDQAAGGEQPVPDQAAGVQGLWRRVVAAAAASATTDAMAKMDWALERGRSGSSSHVPVPDSEVWGAAAASGDLGRVRWLHEHGLGLSARDALRTALEHADLGTIRRLEEQGGYLPAAGDPVWTESYGLLMCSAAGAARDSVAKLRWLAGRRGPAAFDMPEYVDAAMTAAGCGNLEAVQYLAEQYGQHQNNAGTAAAVAALPQAVTATAASSGSVPTLAWLWQEGCALDASCFLYAAQQGNLPMVRWLLEAGCPRGDNCISKAVRLWPCGGTPADSRRLVEAVQLLAAAGWPLSEGFEHPLMAATPHGHPWAIMRALLELQQGDAMNVPIPVVENAAFTGCEATLEALMGMGVFEGRLQGVSRDRSVGVRLNWYIHAMRNGDRGTLECLRRLGVPLDRFLVVGLAPDGPSAAPALAWVKEQQESHGSVSTV